MVSVLEDEYLDFGSDDECSVLGITDSDEDDKEFDVGIGLTTAPPARVSKLTSPGCRKMVMKKSTDGEDAVAADDGAEKTLATTTTTTTTGENSISDAAMSEESGPVPESHAEYYDEIYFDSSDSSDDDDIADKDTGDMQKKRKKQRVPTNDELLFDPNADSDDEEWVQRQRRKCYPANFRDDSNPEATKEGKKLKLKPLPNSDATLTCPACMCVLTRDCQRHDLYKHQYRAMFVDNCSVISDEILRHPLKPPSKKKGHKRNVNEPSDGGDDGLGMDEVYRPVRCEQCDTEVAVFDNDEVFHFFNVIASYG